MSMTQLFTRTMLAATLILAGGAASLSQNQRPSELRSQRVERPVFTPEYGAWGFDISGVEAAAKPGDSFFDHVNGAWDARTTIPSDMARFGMFDALRDRSQEHLRAIIADAASSGATPDTEIGKIGALYNAFMDEARLKRPRATLPYRPRSGRSPRRQDQADIAALMGRLKGRHRRELLPSRRSEDPKDPSRHALFVSQSGLRTSRS
jgi:putative endopeptidase